MSRLSRLVLAATLAGAAALPAVGATLSSATIETFDATVFNDRIGALNSSLVEDFESFTAGEISGPLATSVGRFATIGGTGSGGTVSGTSGNTGTGLFLRDSGVYGRSNTTIGGTQFLDSNDTSGVDWAISGVGFFDRVFFTLSDIADTGADFQLAVGSVTLADVTAKRSNGATEMVMLSFASAIDELTLTFRHAKLNDGFGIDDAGIGLSVPVNAPPPSAVPLPASVALLMAGVTALAGLRRTARRKAA
ncbi:hypothetical protein DKT77_11345 [Meridianimarinicoccus roseus]|uniref:Uncharacterized protein n=1 Tax=Meridianimarinicoccus roseus TaxID=2072018 RepID=A0A2V2LL43_9RHOB|nr:VPLPA-CTERM sorting domain-containing protein [Meridianimarinicoccus roseus]PWR02513.1 hypothetical protein DKT77_11345 [Meridianimarinicoccus roseus]